MQAFYLTNSAFLSHLILYCFINHIKLLEISTLGTNAMIIILLKNIVNFCKFFNVHKIIKTI